MHPVKLNKVTLVYLESRASSALVDSRAMSLFVLIFSSAERVKVLPMRARLMWNIANFTASWNLNMRSFKMDNHCSGHKKMKCSRSDSLRLHLVSILRHSHKYLVKQGPVLAFKDFGTTPHIHIVPTFNWLSLSIQIGLLSLSLHTISSMFYMLHSIRPQCYFHSFFSFLTLFVSTAKSCSTDLWAHFSFIFNNLPPHFQINWSPFLPIYFSFATILVKCAAHWKTELGHFALKYGPSFDCVSYVLLCNWQIKLKQHSFRILWARLSQNQQFRCNLTNYWLGTDIFQFARFQQKEV